MRYLPLVMLSGLLLSACAHQPAAESMPLGVALVAAEPDTTPQNTSTLPTVDTTQPPAFGDRYKLDGFSIGGWVNQKQGTLFQKVTPTDPSSAIVYIYRLASSWNHQEIVAPNFFLNGKRIPSLLDNHYYWIELPAGTYRLNVSHPLAILHFQKGTTVDFTVGGGQQYFLRYEEEGFRGNPDKSLGLLQKGPLAQMPTGVGLQEIASTQLKTPGLSFVKHNNELVEVSSNLPTFNDKKQTRVNKTSLQDKEQLETPNLFKLWNPLTW